MQRAKRALKAQLKLRGEAAGRAQALRDAVEEEGTDAAMAEEGVGEDGGGDRGRQEELEELEGRIATASKVGSCLYERLCSWVGFLCRPSSFVQGKMHARYFRVENSPRVLGCIIS